jgi:hypothetical protein
VPEEADTCPHLPVAKLAAACDRTSLFSSWLPAKNERHYSLSRFGLLPFCVKQSNLRTSVTELSLGAAGF